jgi:hypothetical protein
VDDVGADLAVAPLDPLLDLGEVRIDELAALNRLIERSTSSSQPDVPGDGVRRAAGELGGVAQAARQVECFEDLHGLSGRLHLSLLVPGSQQPQ